MNLCSNESPLLCFAIKLNSDAGDSGKFSKKKVPPFDTEYSNANSLPASVLPEHSSHHLRKPISLCFCTQEY